MAYLTDVAIHLLKNLGRVYERKVCLLGKEFTETLRRIQTKLLHDVSTANPKYDIAMTFTVLSILSLSAFLLCS